MIKTKEIKSQVNSIRNFSSDKKNIFSDSFDNEVIDIEKISNGKKNSLNDFKDKKRRKVQNKKNIFDELLSVTETFVSVDDNYKSNDKYQIKKKIKRHAIDSIKISIGSLKEIIQDLVKKEFFAGEGICGANTKISKNSMRMKPQEIDFLGLLTINPNSNIGKIFYQKKNVTGKEDILGNLYSVFSGGTYDFKIDNTTKLFTLTFNAANQEYQITNLNENGLSEVNEFFNNYFSLIEFPDITGITKTAMYLTIQGDGSESAILKKGINDLEKLLNRLFAICGSKTNKNNIKNQNAINAFDENDENIEEYFDFDSTDDVDFEREDSINRGVLKFKDCNNFEIPVNKQTIEDFAYTINRKAIDDVVDETLEKASNDAYEQSDGSVSQSTFNANLLNNFILNLPKALALSALSPQILLPISLMFKMFKANDNETIEAKVSMRRLSKLFFNIIKELFWRFIQEFWKRIKIELLNFVKFIIIEIKKGKYKRYINIVTSILESLKTVPLQQLNNCENLFGLISQTIDKATTAKGSFIPGIPDISGFILANSDSLPGLTKQKLILDSVRYLESKNFSTDDLYGEKNRILLVIESIFDSLITNFDKYSYIRASNKETIIPSYPSPIVIPPGIITISGKIF